MVLFSRRGFGVALLAAIASVFLPVERVTAQNSGSSSEVVAAIQPAGDPSSWRVTLAEGEARWRRLPTISLETSWQVVEAGIDLPPGTEVLTGTDGQVRLSRADDNIQVGPDTWLTLETDAEDLITRVRQTLGTAWYSVRSRITGRFRVDTARLVAVVKGTEFQIAIGSNADELWVRKGVVNSRATFGGGDIDVRAGQRVRADASGLQLIVAPDGGGGGDRQAPDNSADPSQNGGPGGGGNPNGTGNNRNGDKHGDKHDNRDGDKHDNRDGDKHDDKHGDKHGGKSRDGKGKGRGK